jgi:PAS domain S-box-containing protein
MTGQTTQTTKTDAKRSDYEALLSALNQTALVSMTDAKGTIVYANDKFVEISKYEREELIGQNHRILKSGEQPDDLFIDLWKTISSNNVWRGEIKNKAKDGSFYWVDTSIAPIIGPDNRPDKYIAVRFLISDKKEAFEKLEKQNQQLAKFNKVMVGREMRMKDLKKLVLELKEELRETRKQR